MNDHLLEWNCYLDYSLRKCIKCRQRYLNLWPVWKLFSASSCMMGPWGPADKMVGPTYSDYALGLNNFSMELSLEVITMKVIESYLEKCCIICLLVAQTFWCSITSFYQCYLAKLSYYLLAHVLRCSFCKEIWNQIITSIIYKQCDRGVPILI